MRNFKMYAYCIECITNMHVGTGGDNFGIVDKEIQRDPVDNTPIIHSSSLKGAIREYAETCGAITASLIPQYFGSDKNEQTNLKQGKLRFFEARIITLPVRGVGSVPNYSATSERLINDYEKQRTVFGPSTNKIEIPTTDNNQDATTELGKGVLYSNITPLGNNIALLPDSFMEEALKTLPIIARNSLDNGESQNLWYEEVIPRGSKFFFFIAVQNDIINNYEQELEPILIGDNLVQIGANATIGYGFCKISKL